LLLCCSTFLLTRLLSSNQTKDGGGEGHDREHIALADDQMAFALKAISVGKPTVIVMINGGVISIDGLKESAPAILNAWMPGAHGAGAVAKAIFGLSNPGGKMPVTMCVTQRALCRQRRSYPRRALARRVASFTSLRISCKRSLASNAHSLHRRYPSSYVYDVSMLDMSMQAGPGRSYKFYTGTPLYSFGFGLSYTHFALKWAPHPPTSPRLLTVDAAATTVAYTCTVTNTGAVAGDEVVLAYVVPKRLSFGDAVAASDPMPIKELVAFERVTVAAGATATVTFELPSERFSLVDADGHRSIVPGVFDVVLSRGHGDELSTTVVVRGTKRLSTFRKWW
jgi:hypothetical protein